VIGPLLGHGAMGDVYEAWDIVLARPVALKILQHLEPAAMIRFMHEAQLHARLDSPNICRIYDVDATGGSPRIAMQLIRGPTLEAAAKDLRLDEVVAILAQAAEAVHGAHQLNLIHRDIKPGNILLQWQEGAGWSPYLCDFGLAMALDGPSVTQPLALTGTPAYMAPEQVRGDRSLVGPPTDVYGLGSTLYFALVGRPPCVSTVTAEMLKVKRECRFPAPRSLEPEIPPALEAVLFKCLRPAPQDRYASARELAADLRRIHATLTPPPGGEAATARVPPRARGRRALLGGLAALVALATALPVLAHYLRRERARQDEAAQTLALEAASLDQALGSERMLPAHDLRPAAKDTRARMAAFQARMAALGPQYRGPMDLALGRAEYRLQDLGQAKARLDQAWAAGSRGPDAAILLAQVNLDLHRSLTLQAAFQGQPPPPGAAEAQSQAEQCLQQASLQTSHPREYVDALEADLQGDPRQVAEDAREALAANPWHLESAILGAAALATLGKARLETGDADGAAARYQEALDMAQAALARGQSEPRLHHAALAAALGLATVALERGTLGAQEVDRLARQADQALGLDPDNPEAQSDWLQVAALKTMRLLGLGQDPRAVLDRALRFYWMHTRDPRPPALRMDHLVLYWLQAERDRAQGEDPGPALTEALKDPGHTVTRSRDFLGDLLNLKARVDAAQGRDPRPQAEAIVAGFEPPPDQLAPASQRETAARAWLTRAGWELDHGIDPLGSLRQAQAQLQRALEVCPTSAAAQALQGLAQALEARARPGQRRSLLARAREHLRWSIRLNPWDWDQRRLRVVLSRS